eukprot:1076983-Alexandrium_andersonii.AAC.1
MRTKATNAHCHNAHKGHNANCHSRVCPRECPAADNEARLTKPATKAPPARRKRFSGGSGGAVAPPVRPLAPDAPVGEARGG